jgi:hypothetical protein
MVSFYHDSKNICRVPGKNKKKALLFVALEAKMESDCLM